MLLFDTHTHIHRRPDQLGLLAVLDIEELFERAAKIGVRAVLLASVGRNDWDFLPQLSAHAGVEVVFGFGLHPFFVPQITLDQRRQFLEELSVYVDRAPPGQVAIGECGLDFGRARDADARAVQVEVFEAHLSLSRATGLPLTIHCVKAHGPMVELLCQRPCPPAAMHAFSGSAETARALVDAGHYISFAANVCNPNARRVRAAAEAVPADRLLVETDSPDQTPPARRPAANEPAFIVDVIERLAALRRAEPSALAEQTTANACRLFGLPPFDGRERGE